MFRCLSHRVVFILLSIVLSGCSLLEIKLDSQTTPLTKQELNTRIMTREYTKSFFTQVENAADQTAQQYSESDTLHQSYVLLWKIHSEQGLQAAAYQTSPIAALIDTWVFAEQMEYFFVSGAGNDLFKSEDVKEASIALSAQAKSLAKSILVSNDFKMSTTFVEQFVEDNPFRDMSFKRVPAYRDWLAYTGKSETDAVQTLGTMPEAMGDASDRLSLMAEQTPKLISWKAELVALNSSLTGEDLSLTLANLRDTSSSLQDFIENNPEYMQNLAEIMSAEMQPLINDLSLKTDQKLDKLTLERIALEAMVSREREALIQMVASERIEIAEIVSKERAQFTEDLDRVSQDVVALAVDKLMELIKSVIIYFILFILVVFFAPLGIGYWLGKRTAVNRAK
ncbi:DHH family phosphoesterase [Vibrio sp. 99-70-13A1]|uniref:DHH family phosphoesterase n=1 Tax=Vibrio sp. 99-70-13A1 TaxID=2607601 RepID=UPI0014935E72|nr:DHH family phosphoesterase [Vibrio sp. 99-70-13A1]NOH97629.1 chemotaxis protein [Vibrio sp. 99-70-13A1]